ncbi:MAG TPA: peptide chain release factor N(5)-glutamine methyltransferase [Acidimicrobiia bacterium]|nr:peptide chain release factor N(5)-glutamine methyltransferase [Acidimicrobiia bacterium]
MSGTIPPHEFVRLQMVATGRSRADLLVDSTLDPAERARLDGLVARRRAGEPLQYLEGQVPFGPIEVRVDRRALIPRPETEQLWEAAVAAMGEAGPGTPVVDLGTGSGVLALALKHAFPAAPVYATDLSAEALDLARENAAANGLEVVFLHGDLFAPLPPGLRERVELIVANPPYLSEAEWGQLPTEIRLHEPREALVAGPRGTEVLARIADEARWWLGIGGWVLCEIGEAQSEEVLGSFGDYEREVRPDLAGRPRFLVARKGAPCCR